ncbi:MAG TPA: DUF2304 domain-containing protein [Candidatus Ruthenibacterium avium]|uniref:DUF2304 domain-containing protein n=1 Tax=Candidatus Ruthenibacterium avium TaxID=2838751 RepID=A0A9D2S1P4_9FIRM|nr:DUF2304 domain-containing protein [Candidatus Ruthenibacterium avium]
MMNAHIEPLLRILLLIGVAVYLFVILWLMKKQKLLVRYSIIWLFSAAVLALFAVFPYIVLVLRDLTKIVTPSNLIFMMAIAFLLLISLCLTSIVSGLSEKIKKLAQQNALLERRVRELEEKREER